MFSYSGNFFVNIYIYIYSEVKINLFNQPIVHYILHISKIFLGTFLNIINVKNILFFIFYQYDFYIN